MTISISNSSVNMQAAPDTRVQSLNDMTQAVVQNAKALRANAEALIQIAKAAKGMPAPVSYGIYVEAQPAAPLPPQPSIWRASGADFMTADDLNDRSFNPSN